MRPSHHNNKQNIERLLAKLKSDHSVIQNFIDTEVLEDYWSSIALQETNPKEFKLIRQAVEQELVIFAVVLRGVYLSTAKTLTEPDFMKSGQKKRETFLTQLFQSIKHMDTSVLTQLEHIAQHPLSYYQGLYMKWKIAKKRENDAPKSIKTKGTLSQKFKLVLEALVNLAEISERP